MEWRITNNHDEIRSWMESRSGVPAVIRGSTQTIPALSILMGESDAILRKEGLEPITWDEFFDSFETNRLSFRYAAPKNGSTNAEEELDSDDLDGSQFSFVARDGSPATNNDDFIFPESSDTARENIFSSEEEGARKNDQDD